MDNITQNVDQFEKESFSFLKSMQLAVVGYYPYEYCIDIIGYVPPGPPFTVPIRTMVEILRTKATLPIVERFSKLSQDSGAQRSIIISENRLSELDADTRTRISDSRIEYLERSTIKGFIDDVGEPAGALALEDFSPEALAKHLPELSKQLIPSIMEETVKLSKLEAWQVFEHSVTSIYRFCFSYTVKPLGKETLFKHEPEGIVLVQDPENFALIYECKTAKESYQMTSDHELRYSDYIETKKPVVKSLYNCELQYFAIIAPSFTGDIKERRETIFRKTGVLAVFLPATVMSELALWTLKLENRVRRLIDLKQIFSISETQVSIESVRRFMKDFDARIKSLL